MFEIFKQESVSGVMGGASQVRRSSEALIGFQTL
jgi:hypothetical protein